MKNTTVTNKNGYELDFDTAVKFMKDDICEMIRRDYPELTAQEFFTRYEFSHEIFEGEEWFLSAANPTMKGIEHDEKH